MLWGSNKCPLKSAFHISQHAVQRCGCVLTPDSGCPFYRSTIYTLWVTSSPPPTSSHSTLTPGKPLCSLPHSFFLQIPHVRVSLFLCLARFLCLGGLQAATHSPFPLRDPRGISWSTYLSWIWMLEIHKVCYRRGKTRLVLQRELRDGFIVF